MRSLRHLLLVLALLVGVAAAAPATAGEAAAAGPTMTSLFVTSFDGTQIDLNVCRPATATADNPVPIVLESHGWIGQKAPCLKNTDFFDAGIGYASMTQRGNGESTGENNIMDPDFEGRDIMAVIDHLASLDWVKKDDGPGGTDPVLGGLGESYGGGFQWVGAFSDQYFRDAPTRFNALQPGITWYDLRQALGPNDVLRSVMVSGLYAAGVRDNNLAPFVHAGIGSWQATGQLPADFGSELHQHGAAWFVEQGQTLDIPVYIRQGAMDTAFNLNQGIDAFEKALTPAARERSLLVNNQSGHNVAAPLPGQPLPYTKRTGAYCDAPSTLAWFKHTLLGEPLDLGARLKLRTVDGACINQDEFPATTPTAVPALSEAVLPIGGGPLRLEPIATGPMTLAGAPKLTMTARTTDPDARLFWGLAVGTSPEDAQLIGGQWMPTRITGPVLNAPVATELAAIVAELDEGETLYLAVSPSADQFAAHGSRSAGTVIVSNVTVGLPVVQPASPSQLVVSAPSAAPVSGAPFDVTVTATAGEGTTDTSWEGTPQLTTSDGHATLPACQAAVTGVATCSGVTLGDLGGQTLTASDGDHGQVPAQLTVQPTGVTFVSAPERTKRRTDTTYTTAPTVGVSGASTEGYLGTQSISTSDASDTIPGTRACSGSSCDFIVQFDRAGPHTVTVTEEAGRATPAARTVVTG